MAGAPLSVCVHSVGLSRTAICDLTSRGSSLIIRFSNAIAALLLVALFASRSGRSANGNHEARQSGGSSTGISRNAYSISRSSCSNTLFISTVNLWSCRIECLTATGSPR